MKKIGILFGMEQSFPYALLDKINNYGRNDIIAEMVKVGAVTMNKPLGYDVILDRVSDEVPFYKSILKQSVLNGTKVINDPFWSCADDNFYHLSLAQKLGIKSPKTAIIPSKEHPPGTCSETMKNLIYPLNWDEIFEFIGFPAYIKSNRINGFYTAFKVYNKYEFFAAYDLTGDKVMILQEAIEFDSYFKCYVIGQKHIRIMKYDPTKPQHLRYSPDELVLDSKLAKKIENIAKKVSTALGFDFNALEIAVKNNSPIVMDFLNNAPNADINIIYENNFNWLVDKTAELLIEYAEKKYELPDIYTFSSLLKKKKTVKKSENKKDK